MIWPSLWQAGFRNTTCAIGTHLTPAQWSQLCDQPGRCVYIAFDQDANQAGQRASRLLAQRLESAGLRARIVALPPGHDPNSYFVAGATRRRLSRLPQGGRIAYETLLTYPPPRPASAFRIVADEMEKKSAWANDFLDAQGCATLAAFLRSYAYDLLHFARWWWRPTAPPLSQIDESALADYVRFQLDEHPRPSPQTVNHRLTVVLALLRFHLGTLPSPPRLGNELL